MFICKKKKVILGGVVALLLPESQERRERGEFNLKTYTMNDSQQSPVKLFRNILIENCISFETTKYVIIIAFVFLSRILLY